MYERIVEHAIHAEKQGFGAGAGNGAGSEPKPEP